MLNTFFSVFDIYIQRIAAAADHVATAVCNRNNEDQN